MPSLSKTALVLSFEKVVLGYAAGFLASRYMLGLTFVESALSGLPSALYFGWDEVRSFALDVPRHPFRS